MKSMAIAFLSVCFFLFACDRPVDTKDVLRRSFYETVWERFDYVTSFVTVTEPTTYDLSLRIGFTDDYPYDDFSMVFAVFDSEGNPYRAKAYKFSLKDAEGRWRTESKDGCHTYTFPINKKLGIAESGTYKFVIEQTMPITPVVGVKELALIKN